MNKSNRWISAAMLCATVVCATVAIAACSSDQPPPVDPSFSPAGPTSGMSAPVILNLQGPNPIPNGGPITLDLEIVANEPIQAPVSLIVRVPPGTQLVGGAPSETLSLPQAGRYYRRFVVQTQGRLTQPVIVEADAQGPNNSWGFHARREYPEAAQTPITPQRHPGGRPPAVRP
ncbi:MAG: hypothetical protein FWD57_00260 [Polyangiaceae bacterium]|nr:hypothetical protein [Polyangiaceae bacterium]